ncbi:SMP-30/gluconolactonase/LRE family protein [Ensifer sp. IC3342]|nr:SMP-30/gluconolactonase/LRE family protein [Ensifer sp. BRP08]MCA1450804.1 SMP-30/gluconolactonase/LRE family protein [Ensifer sp. IC3342]
MNLQVILRRFAIATAVLVVLLVLAFAIVVQSSDFTPARWTPGPYTQNTRNTALREARPVGDETLSGPEDVAIDSRGHILAGTVDGAIWRADLNAETPRFERFASVGGRPLGLVVGADDVLYVANHGIGLQAVSPDGQVRRLLTEVDGTPILFANDLAIDTDGVIFFSDSSSRYNFSTIGVQGTYGVPDLLEGRPFGRVIRFDTRSGAASVLAEGLYFPNGIAISRDGRSSGLGDGRMLLAAYHRTPVLDEGVLPSWFMRHFMSRLPNSFFTLNAPNGFVAVIDDQTGEVLQEFHGGKGEAAAPANAVLWRGELFSGTLFGSAVSRIRLPIEPPLTQASAD